MALNRFSELVPPSPPPPPPPPPPPSIQIFKTAKQKCQTITFQQPTTRNINIQILIFFIDDFSVSGISKVDPFLFLFVSLKVSAFPCPSVTDFPFL